MGKSQKQARRELIEKMQRDQARADKRRTLLIVVASVVVGLAIIAYPAVKLIQDSRTRNAPLADIGVPAGAASCDAIVSEAAVGNGVHKPDGTVIKYAQSPPTSGEHYETWAPFGKKFYAKDDRPEIPYLVHNLEHGYTILWYNDAIAGDEEKMAQIEKLSKGKLPESSTGKFIAAPFHADDGAAWPAGKNIAFSHWSGGTTPGDKATEKGHRQFCADVSGEALNQFMEKYPAMDAPEPGAG